MLKKITFLVVLLCGLYIASVSAYAAETDSITPTGIAPDSFSGSFVPAADLATNKDIIVNDNTTGAYDEAVPSQIPDKIKKSDEQNASGDAPEEESNIADPGSESEITDYAGVYGDVFFDPASSTDDIIISMKKWNHNDFSNDPLSYVLSGTVIPNPDDPSDSPVIILFYIKSDGQYVPLYLTDVPDSKTNMLVKESPLIVSYVDLLHIGSDKPNEVRIIAFRKEDANNLVLGENLQVTNLSIVVRKNIIEGIPFIVNVVLNSLELKK
jgi:hypothetical protein